MEFLMNRTVVIVGIGELGGVFAKGCLRTGHPVCPVTRDMSISDAAKNYPEPLCVLIAVAENNLPDVLTAIPLQWQNRLGLLQNELLPCTWEAYNIKDPTLVIVWFEKKKGQAHKVLLPSRIYGANARLFSDALESIDIPSTVLSNKDDMLFELVLKNVYVLTMNIAGLKTGGTVRSLWTEHNDLVRRIAVEVIDIQEWLTKIALPHDRLIDGLEMAVNGDPEHKCVGRSAHERLDRIVKTADEADLEISAIRKIQNTL